MKPKDQKQTERIEHTLLVLDIITNLALIVVILIKV